MRNFIVLSLFTVVAATAAQARSPMPTVWYSDLTRFNIDEQMAKPGEVTRGRVVIDYAEKQVRVVLERRFHCPEGRYCAQSMPAPIVIKLPIVSVAKNGCGEPEVHAMLDRRPVDGAAQRLTVRDYTISQCRYIRANPDTLVTYDTISSGMGGHVSKTHSTFEGTRLAPASRGSVE